ncbi:SNF1-related protein kinase regulatory subunit beta-3 [Bienertia sinuspersici]
MVPLSLLQHTPKVEVAKIVIGVMRVVEGRGIKGSSLKGTLFMILHHLGYFLNMSTSNNDEKEVGTVMGFETPESPSSSYTSAYPGNEDEAREPPIVPPHLHQSLLSCPPSRETACTLPLPQNVIVNHLYIENREAPRSVVALGFTHRFRSKFVTVVLYKPVPRRGSNA